jgi:3-hydroxy acid dehydrogenase / malonic semialdehyde reductase
MSLAPPVSSLSSSSSLPSPDVVLVTGATSGIGAACARKFAAIGARLILAGRRHDRLEELAVELASVNAAAPLLLDLDVRDRNAVYAAIAGLPDPFAAIDLLVNNAGLALGVARAHEASPDDFDAMMETNMKGLVHMTRAVLPGMVARDRGHIVNMGSVAGTYPYPGGNVYGASKAFVAQLSLNLRADLLGTNVRVTCIEPGMVETEFSLVRNRGDASIAASVYRGMTPMSPEDIADVVHYCATRPAHLNVNRIELMATSQAFSTFAVHRTPD